MFNRMNLRQLDSIFWRLERHVLGQIRTNLLPVSGYGAQVTSLPTTYERHSRIQSFFAGRLIVSSELLKRLSKMTLSVYMQSLSFISPFFHDCLDILA